MSVSHLRKKRRLNPPADNLNGDVSSSESEAQQIDEDEFSRRAAKWNLEQDYERKPRKQGDKQDSLRLPIKTAEGRIEHVSAPQIERPDSGSSLDEFGENSDDDAGSLGEEMEEQGQEEAPQQSAREQILQAKEDLAKIAGQINENPEENASLLGSLAHITRSRNNAVTKLGLVTQLAVFKDIVPGYRIRPLSEDSMKERLSKDVRRLRNFEQAIVRGYQRYVQELARIAALEKGSISQDTAGLVTVAVSCACNLLNSVPHFNYRSELLKIVVDKLGRGHRSQNFQHCCHSLGELFASDEEGNASLEAVTLLSKMIKAKHCHVDGAVLNVFLQLRLLSEFSHKASDTKVDRDNDDAVPQRGKKGKDKREFRTKKERKLVRERKAIEKEMKEADAIVGNEELDRIQAETLKLVFSVYLRVLKARTPHLMGPVLEGLVKYAHLINQDFFGDLLESLKDLITESEEPAAAIDAVANGDGTSQPVAATEEDENGGFARNATRESLLCVITAFALLQGQDAAAAASTLHLDLSFFISHLYRTLYPASLNADIELSANKTQHLRDPAEPDAPQQQAASQPRTKVDVQTSIVLLLRSLHAVLLPANARAVPPARLAAFAKQLMTAALQLPEKSSAAVLGLLRQVLKTHRSKVAALWNTEERRGDGVFEPLVGQVERSNPFAATVWEGELLRLHFAPHVRESVSELEKLVVQQWQ